MSTPKGMRNHPIVLQTGDQVHVSRDAQHLSLQLRRRVPTEEDLLKPSCKVAVELTPIEALRLINEVVQLVVPRLTEKPSSDQEGSPRGEDDESV